MRVSPLGSSPLPPRAATPAARLANVHACLNWSERDVATLCLSLVWRSILEKEGPGARRGRPRGSSARAASTQTYRDLEAYGAAVKAYCRREMAALWPFIDLEELRRIVRAFEVFRLVRADERDDELSSPPPVGAPPIHYQPRSRRGRELRAILSGHRLLPEVAFPPLPVEGLPFPEAARVLLRSGRILHFESTVRALEYLWVRCAYFACLAIGAGRALEQPTPATSRAFAIASLAVGRRIPGRGHTSAPHAGWSIACAVKAEEDAVGYWIDEIIDERKARLS